MAHHPISDFVRWFRNLIAGTSDALFETAQAIHESLQEEGDPVRYPIDWDTEVQKRAYFATGGFGSGIPYQRTHAYRYGGEPTREEFGARIYKPHPAGAIGGTFSGWQSSIHRGRWKLIMFVVYAEVDKLPQRIRDRVRVTEGNLNAGT